MPRLPLLRNCCLLVLVASLTACVKAREARENVLQVRDKLKEQTIETQERFKEMFTYNPEGRPKPRPVPTAFCYQVTQDIICYNQPLAGAQYRLVGWQGTFEGEDPRSLPSAMITSPNKAKEPAAPVTAPKKSAWFYPTPHPKYGPIKTPAPASTATAGSKPVEVARNPAVLRPLEPLVVGNAPEIKADPNQVVIHESPDSRLF